MKNERWNRQKLSTKNEIEFILFFFKMFIDAEFRYWSIEFEMTILIWTIRKIFHMIRIFKHFTIIYTNHETNLNITTETKLNITNINKFNLKLIRISIYLSQFRFDIRHRFDKTNIISNIFNKLFIKSNKISKHKNLDINAKNSKSNFVYVYNINLLKMSFEFRKNLIKNYVKNSIWKKIKFMLRQLIVRIDIKKKQKIKQTIKNRHWFQHRKQIDIFYWQNQTFMHINFMRKNCVRVNSWRE